MEQPYMAAILDAAKAAYQPGSGEHPDKAFIIRLFGMIEVILGSAVSGLVIGNAVTYATKAELNGNLDVNAGTLGVVFNDGGQSGVYEKVGPRLSGSWAETDLTLPASFAGDLAEAIADIATLKPTVEGKLDKTLGAFSELIRTATTKSDPVDLDTVILRDSEAVDGEGNAVVRRLLWSHIKASLKSYFDPLYASLAAFSGLVKVAASKSAPVDGDSFVLRDSEALDADGNFIVRRISWASLKSALKEYFDALYASLSTFSGLVRNASAKNLPVDTDSFIFRDSEALDDTGNFIVRRISWSALKGSLRAYFDTVYGTPPSLSKLIGSAETKSSLIDTDDFAMRDSEAKDGDNIGLIRKIRWGTIKSNMKAYLDAFYIDRPKLLGDVTAPPRPGEGISFYSAATVGNPSTLDPLPDGASVASAFGMVARLEGAGTIAPVTAWRIEPGHLYRLRFVIRRDVDTLDPANDAVRLAVQWLGYSKGDAGITELTNVLDLMVSDGRQEFTFTLATVGADGVDAASPASAVYFRPFVRSFGSGVTDIEVVEVIDASDAVIWSPNVQLLQNQISGLSAQLQVALDRIEALEQPA